VDLSFDNNTIDGAVTTGNDLGIFMLDSRDNRFEGVVMVDDGGSQGSVSVAISVILAACGRLGPSKRCRPLRK